MDIVPFLGCLILAVFISNAVSDLISFFADNLEGVLVVVGAAVGIVLLPLAFTLLPWLLFVVVWRVFELLPPMVQMSISVMFLGTIVVTNLYMVLDWWKQLVPVARKRLKTIAGLGVLSFPATILLCVVLDKMLP